MIKTTFRFPNGKVYTADENGKALPEFGGEYSVELHQKITEASDENTQWSGYSRFIDMDDNPFDVEHHFNFYLQTAGYNVGTMPPDQFTQLKNAFMGAFGQSLIVFSKNIGEINDEDRALLTIDDMFVQLEIYWNSIRSEK